jgi:hypothetical protein
MGIGYAPLFDAEFDPQLSRTGSQQAQPSGNREHSEGKSFPDSGKELEIRFQAFG